MTLAGNTGFETPCGGTAVIDAEFSMLEIAGFGNHHAAIDTLAGELGLAETPQPGRATGKGPLRLFSAAPCRWWLRVEQNVLPLPEIEGLAVTETGDGQVCIRLRGDTVREWLAQYCALDLRPRSFDAGRVAWTLVAEVRVLLHCVAGDAFDLYLGLSYAEDFVTRCLKARPSAST